MSGLYTPRVFAERIRNAKLLASQYARPIGVRWSGSDVVKPVVNVAVGYWLLEDSQNWISLEELLRQVHAVVDVDGTVQHGARWDPTLQSKRGRR